MATDWTNASLDDGFRYTIAPEGFSLKCRWKEGDLEGSFCSWRLVSLGPTETLIYYTTASRNFSSLAQSLEDDQQTITVGVNVSAALSMAGIGPHKTTIRIYADPNVTRNTHEIVAEGEFGKLSIKIENVPTAETPRTGALSALSALATLRRITSHVRIGT